MPFIKIEGFKGKIFVPDMSLQKKKHPCDDCFQCQFCSNERCELCLKKKKLNSPPSDKKSGE